MVLNPLLARSLQPCLRRPCMILPIRWIASPATTRPDTSSGNTYTQPAEKLSQNVSEEEKIHYSQRIEDHKQKQVRTPWHREGAEVPPVEKDSSDVLTKGKLLTTPSRMLKLILPLITKDAKSDDERIEPLALLVHPQQPLSYLERLIQSELPRFEDKDGKERIPNVWFRAEDSTREMEDSNESSNESGESIKDADLTMIDGKSARTGKLHRHSPRVTSSLRGGPGEGGVESYGGHGQEAPGPLSSSSSSSSSPSVEAKKEDSASKTSSSSSSSSDPAANFVRWSSSTEVGDFIRDAARARFFAVEIESAPRSVLVGVPSFKDRTYYLRLRLRKRSREIARLADVKRACDEIAERGAKGVAVAGGCALVGYWWVVYLLTFRSDLGWDTVEPVTYLVGLSTLIGGYGWFLIHNRQVSYHSAMQFTISRRQSKLYEQKGFDLRRWEDLIDEGNKLRTEIKAIAQEYDVEWDEKQDAESEKVIEALKNDRKRKKKDEEGGKSKDDDD